MRDSSGGVRPWSKPRIDVTTRLGARLVSAVQSGDMAIREGEAQAYELTAGDVGVLED